MCVCMSGCQQKPQEGNRSPEASIIDSYMFLCLDHYAGQIPELRQWEWQKTLITFSSGLISNCSGRHMLSEDLSHVML